MFALDLIKDDGRLYDVIENLVLCRYVNETTHTHKKKRHQEGLI